MRSFLRKNFIIIFMLMELILSLSISSSNTQYKLGLRESDTMTYQYTIINVELLDFLAEHDPSYWGLSGIEVNTQIEWKVYEISSNTSCWNVKSDVYRVMEEKEYLGDFEVLVFKSPADLSNNLFNGSGTSPYFLPINTTAYLVSFKDYIPLNYSDICIVNNTDLVFDWRFVGSNDTIVYSYNIYGVMDGYYILCDYEIALAFELINYSKAIEEFDYTFWIAITSISIISLVLVTIFVKKKYFKKKRVTFRKKRDKLLKKIK